MKTFTLTQLAPNLGVILDVYIFYTFHLKMVTLLMLISTAKHTFMFTTSPASYLYSVTGTASQLVSYVFPCHIAVYFRDNKVILLRHKSRCVICCSKNSSDFPFISVWKPQYLHWPIRPYKVNCKGSWFLYCLLIFYSPHPALSAASYWPSLLFPEHFGHNSTSGPLHFLIAFALDCTCQFSSVAQS